MLEKILEHGHPFVVDLLFLAHGRLERADIAGLQRNCPALRGLEVLTSQFGQVGLQQRRKLARHGVG
jgi:hypothetical protein